MDKNSIAGIAFPREIPEGLMPLDAIAIVKVMTPSGELKTWSCATGSLSSMEAYGMLELVRRQLGKAIDEVA